jgi:TPR repeat protein
MPVKRIALVFLAALLMAQPVWAAYMKWVVAYEEGYAAYKKADYETALKKWKPLAKKGYVPAQYSLGLMFARGDGVPKSSEKATRWYLQAAMKGHDCYFIAHQCS